MFLKSLWLLFSVEHEHRLREYSKSRAYQMLFKITHNKTIKRRIKIINSLFCCSNTRQVLVNSVICFAKDARASIVLIIEWVQFVLQNCEKQHSVRSMQAN